MRSNEEASCFQACKFEYPGIKPFCTPGCTTLVHPGGEGLYTYMYSGSTPGWTEEFLTLQRLIFSIVTPPMLLGSHKTPAMCGLMGQYIKAFNEQVRERCAREKHPSHAPVMPMNKGFEHRCASAREIFQLS